MKTPKKIMDAAGGEECTLNIVGVCRNDTETTVACHLPDGSGGSSKFAGPLSIAFGCSKCHDCVDRRNSIREWLTEEDREFYMRRGMMRTMTRLVERNILKW